MKYAVLALALQSISALQLQDDVRMSEDDLFLQLAQAEPQHPQIIAEHAMGIMSNPNWGDLSSSGWGDLAPGKAPLDLMDSVRDGHSATVQDHLHNRVFTDSHNSADELNALLKKKGDENDSDPEPK